MGELIYREECFQIIGFCMEVHSTLGPGLSEVVYKDALEHEFTINNIPYQREKEYTIHYKEIILRRKYYADFVAFDNIILEIKADKNPLENHFKQILNYLNLAKSPLGIIINFGESSLKYKRVVQNEFL